MVDEMKQSEQTQIAVLTEQVKTVATAVTKMDSKLDSLVNKFVTKEEFWPIKALVYGFTGLILVTVIGALIMLVLRKP